MSKVSEAQALAAISRVFAISASDSSLLVGIGDDAAVVATPTAGMKSLFASDMAVEGSHFRRDWSSLREIGGKVAAANIADIYAMGGRARYGLVSVGLPSDFSLAEVEELARGIADEFATVDARVIGGDLTRSEKLTISIAMIGEAENPILRSGARAGDSIVISGLPGRSALGYELLISGVKDQRSALHRKPVVEYAKILKLVDATSLIDTSDGLVSEAGHIASQSGVRLSLNSELISALPGFAQLEDDALRLALHGGEDHCFLATVRGATPEGFYRIGTVESGSGVTIDGVEISHQGFDQFR